MNIARYNKAIVAGVGFLGALATAAGFDVLGDPKMQNTIISGITWLLVFAVGNAPKKN